ncbi:hypothetical protein [Frigoriflavimonas asaccharolytica]|uniref:Uncharacterized protein n=1 Tax=Frigoriflavimonas asaccharolytica TaxID=2735899 RepID=A0A8J8K611_9FLAO|nr:hypothetical protein [Frigoriflavimonas asaccharolytica]NRS93225.1 hypothetical protein [Frigoriflavimonas asaccharolytica]
MKKFLFLIIPTILLFNSCESKVEKVIPAFYYWKSDSYFSDKEKEITDEQNIQKMYVKFFEVDYSDALGNFPIAKTNFSANNYCNDNKFEYEIIPTVYLKNIVFKKSTKAELVQLADDVNFLINKYTKERLDSLEIKEFQMDCDWTESTKDNYFYFLKELKKVSSKSLSCTLRLYPYKYPDKMGVPPVDKATLMCYNLINPLENSAKNSILDLDELKSYLSGKQNYPLHLDVALPLYSWSQLYQNNQFQKIIYTGKEFQKSMKKIKPLWYEVTKDTAIDYETYLKVGDKIKYEEIDANTINKAISILKNELRMDKEITVSLFHLDENQLSNYSNEEISSFYSSFTK